jgi:hypothetical protein
LVGQGDGGAEDTLLAQGRTGLCADVGLRGRPHRSRPSS